jgi:hypothetical protein
VPLMFPVVSISLSHRRVAAMTARSYGSPRSRDDELTGIHFQTANSVEAVIPGRCEASNYDVQLHI